MACNKQRKGMKNELKISNRHKTDISKQKLFQMFDSIYAGFIIFICYVILYRVTKILTTA